MHIEIRDQRAYEHARRADAVQRLDNLDLIDAAGGDLYAPDEPPMFTILVDGVPLPVVAAGYEVIPTDAGPVVTVALPATSVTVGEPAPTTAPTTQPSPTQAIADAIRDAMAGQKATDGPRTTWGPPKQDPREAIPGWAPEAVDA